MKPSERAEHLGWQVVAEAVEGNAHRVIVEQGALRGMLYVYDDPVHATRVAWAHASDRAAQLFAVPEVIDHGVGWCLLQGIDGMPLSDYMAAHGLRQVPGVLATELGELLRKLHSTNLTGESVFGDPIEGGTRWLTFNGYVAAKFERFAEDVRTLDVDDTVAGEILNAIGQIRQELASFHPRSPTTLVHGKVDPQHIWVDPQGRSVVGLTGFETCALLPAEVDLAWLLWIKGFEVDDLARYLYRGYGAARTMDVQRRERFYRRLVAFHALYGDFGKIDADRGRLIQLAVDAV